MNNNVENTNRKILLCDEHILLTDDKVAEGTVKKTNNFSEAMLNRARFFCFVNEEVALEDIKSRSNQSQYYTIVAEEIVDSLKNRGTVELLPRVYGYLFAKSIELQLSNNLISHDVFTYPMDIFDLKCIEAKYFTDDWIEIVTQKVEEAYKLGHHFFEDFSLFYDVSLTDEVVSMELINSLILVQEIGEMYAKYNLVGYPYYGYEAEYEDEEY